MYMKKIIALVLAALVALCGLTVFSSAAEGFAYGDANRDGKINIKDATYIQRFVAMMTEFDQQELKLADVNADSKVNIKDATMVQKLVAKLISGFPADTLPQETTASSVADETTFSSEVVTDTEFVTTNKTEATEVETNSTEGETEINTDPAEDVKPTQPVKPTKPAQTDPAETTAPTKPAETDPVETTVPTKPVVTDPAETTVPTKPVVPTKPSIDDEGYFNQIIRP